jgi:hypothetical protein
MRLCELQPRLAQLARHFCLIRSMTHTGNISNHFDAMHNCLAGQANAPADAPYLGSVLAKLRPNQRNVASYVWLMKCLGDPVFCAPNIGSGGSLGAPFAPIFVGTPDNNPSKPGFKAPDVFTPAEPETLLERRHLLESLDRAGNSGAGLPSAKYWNDLRAQAFDLATSSTAREIFELDREPVALRDRYGRHPLGQNLLLARRFVEAGVGFVTVNGWAGYAPGQKGERPASSSWDMHGGTMGMENAFGNGSYGMGWCLPRLDEALSTLLTDLDDRGLLASTLVVVVGEFGRTPQVSKPVPGRHHWPACFSAILAGAGIRGGQVYGQSDKIGAYVKDKPVQPPDLAATIYHALGVPHDPQLSKNGVSRPLTTGQPIHALFGG